MAGKFELFKDKKGEFRFRLKATNGQILLASEGYKARAGAVIGMESVKKNSATEARFVKKKQRNGKFMFTLMATNGRTIGVSEAYDTEKACDNGMKSVAKNAPAAKLVDLLT